jgi:hypothetical protein
VYSADVMKRVCGVMCSLTVMGGSEFVRSLWSLFDVCVICVSSHVATCDTESKS